MSVISRVINKIKNFGKQPIIKDHIKMWGEVQVILKNEVTGKIDYEWKGTNTLMQPFIDNIVGNIGDAPGIDFLLNDDIRDSWYKFHADDHKSGIGALDILISDRRNNPEIILLGNNSADISNTDADLLGVVAGTAKNVYVSKEGGSGQDQRDNILIKVATTYETNEAVATIRNIGLYSNSLRRLRTDLTANDQYTDGGPNIIHKVYTAASGFLHGGQSVVATYTEKNIALPLAGFSFNKTTQQINLNAAFAAPITSPLIFYYSPEVSSPLYTEPPAGSGEYLCGIVLPQDIIKTNNHSLTVIWLIHFDAQT